jgi:hypothetical protein
VIPENQTSFLSFEYDYDGTNNLQYALPASSGFGGGSGLIERGPVPSSTGTDSGDVVWLAYASGRYFQGLEAGTATSLQPLRSPHGLIRRYAMPAEWKLAAEEPFLPVEISYYATNVPVLDDTGNVTSVPLDKARAPKYVAAHLRTWDAVPFQGMRIPRHFECINYGPWPRPGTPGIGSVIRGYATNVCSLIPFPSLPSTLHLQDNRVPEPAIVVYPVISGDVPALDTDFMTNARARGSEVFEGRLPRANPKAAENGLKEQQ